MLRRLTLSLTRYWHSAFSENFRFH